MFAVYLSVPEAENSRKALNTSNGIRRAKLLGRHPGKAPLGYMNLTYPDGRKYIALKKPEATIMKWSFQQLAKNFYTIEEVRRMANAKGLRCSRSNFWKLIHNPVYCGLIPVSSSSQEQQLVQGIHEPLINELLFNEVQKIIGSKRRVVGKNAQLKETFVLLGHLTCPVCSRKLRGSFSRGRRMRYPYYHCSGNCKARFKAECINGSYEKQLQQLVLSSNAIELFRLVVEDTNANTERVRYLRDRSTLLKQLDEQEVLISKARKLFIADKLQYDDFSELKKDYLSVSGTLKKEFGTVITKLKGIDRQILSDGISLRDVFKDYQTMDIATKKAIVSMVYPAKIDMQKITVSLTIHKALAKVLITH